MTKKVGIFKGSGSASRYINSYSNFFKDIPKLDARRKGFLLTEDFLNRYSAFLYSIYKIKDNLKKGRTDTSSSFVQDLLAAYIKETLKDASIYIDYPLSCYINSNLSFIPLNLSLTLR